MTRIILLPDWTLNIESGILWVHDVAVEPVATLSKLSKLFGALAEQNVDRAEQIAAEIVRDEERKGHHGAARTLRGSLANGVTGSHPLNGDTQRAAFAKLFSEALSPQDTSVSLAEIALRSAMRNELTTIVKEWRNQRKLDKVGIRRRSRLFFYGPPGCGKSITARALGHELCLPTYIVRFDGVIGAYLGQTAVHLRELFRFAERTPCVLMFDEVDALGKQRGNPLDVGELDRIVIAFMQELEHTHPAGLVIATSNLPGELDAALWRRFDLMLEFPAPKKPGLKEFASKLAKTFNVQPNRVLRNRITQAKSYAEAERIVESEARRNVLAQCDKLDATERKRG